MHLNMKSFWKISIFVLLGSLSMTACKKDKDRVNEEELITTVILRWTPEAGGDVLTFLWRDLDGEGGEPPVIMTEPLAANTAYRVDIELLNETEDPVEDVTAEVLATAKDHQFFFQAHHGLEMAFEYLDSDSNGNPLGLATRMTTGNASSGHLKVILLHHPRKNNAGVKDGDISNAGGHTDIEVTFDVTIQ
jgi:hypothetical protein